MNELLGLVDALAAELGRPVGLDDRRFSARSRTPRMSARSIACGATDPPARAAPPEVTQWLGVARAGEADGVVHVPANGELAA